MLFQRLLKFIIEHIQERNLSNDLECQKSFTVPTAFKVHLQTHSGEKPLKTFKCLHVTNLLLRQAILNRIFKHLRTHTGEKPFKCLEMSEVLLKYISEHIQDNFGLLTCISILLFRESLSFFPLRCKACIHFKGRRNK